MEETTNTNNTSRKSDCFSSTVQLTPPDGTDTKSDGPYDPFEQRDIDHPTTEAGALAHLLKCSLGTGILAMPNAFRNAGVVLGVIGCMVLGVVCTHCVHILVKSSHLMCHKCRQPSLTFAGTAQLAVEHGPKRWRAYGGWARNFVNAALVATYYTSLAVYVVFIARNLQAVVEYYLQVSDTEVRYYIAPLVVPLSLLCLVRNLRYLVPFSVVANAFIGVSFALTLYYMFSGDGGGGRDLVAAPDRLPLFLSTVIFAMEGIGAVMPVENSMRNPRRFLGCPGILNIAMGVVVTLYAVIGLFGYLRYGDRTEASVTLNLGDDTPAQVVKVLIALAILFTYPLQFHVATEIVLDVLRPRLGKARERLWETLYRVLVVCLTVSVAAAVPDLGPIISLVGAVCFSTLGLLCPAAIETAACWHEGLGVARWRLYKNGLIAAVALLALVSGSYASVLEILEEYGHGRGQPQ